MRAASQRSSRGRSGVGEQLHGRRSRCALRIARSRARLSLTRSARSTDRRCARRGECDARRAAVVERLPVGRVDDLLAPPQITLPRTGTPPRACRTRAGSRPTTPGRWRAGRGARRAGMRSISSMRRGDARARRARERQLVVAAEADDVERRARSERRGSRPRRRRARACDCSAASCRMQRAGGQVLIADVARRRGRRTRSGRACAAAWWPTTKPRSRRTRRARPTSRSRARLRERRARSRATQHARRPSATRAAATPPRASCSARSASAPGRSARRSSIQRRRSPRARARTRRVSRTTSGSSGERPGRASRTRDRRRSGTA